MKKFILLALLVVGSFSVYAQKMSTHAIGLKFGWGVGDYVGSGADISYQRALDDINRVELNLSFTSGSGYSGMSVGGYYQWVYNIQDGLNWYAGPGASLGAINIKDGDNIFTLGVGGQVGLEYRFDFPLQLTLDVNPHIGFLNSEGFSLPIMLGVRYVF